MDRLVQGCSCGMEMLPVRSGLKWFCPHTARANLCCAKIQQLVSTEHPELQIQCLSHEGNTFWKTLGKSEINRHKKVHGESKEQPQAACNIQEKIISKGAGNKGAGRR